jgi:branched-chain amino acid transport system substrate-binding protein
MMHGTLTRRTLLKGGLASVLGVAFVGPWRWARAQPRTPILLGLTCDASGSFADSGQADRRGIVLAIDEFNAVGGVLGRPVEPRWEDTASDPAVAVRVAQRMIERDHVDFVIGALSSAVAAPLAELAQRHGVVYGNTNSSSDTVTGERCQRTSFAFDANNAMLAAALGPLVAPHLGKRWFFLTHDHAWGRAATAAAREAMRKVGAEEVGELAIAAGTRDFSAQLLRIRSAKPHVVLANVAGVEQTTLREQAAEFESDRDAHWLFPQQDFPDLLALGPRRSFGYFITTWHHTLGEPGAQDFVGRFRKRWAGAPIDVPDNVSVNGYVTARELLRAVERAGGTKNHDVIRQLEGHVIKDNFRKYPSVIREWDHLVGQMLYLAKCKKPSEMKDRYDRLELIADLPPEQVSPPREASKCRMQSFADTPLRGG